MKSASENPLRRLAGITAIAIAFAATTAPLHAQLPASKDKKWPGYFLGFENKALSFGITAKGNAEINVIGRKGTPLSKGLSIQADFIVEESSSDGRPGFQHWVMPETLQVTNPEADKIQNIVIKGQVQGGATFEAFFNEERGVVSMGGHLVSPGTNNRSPLKFSIRLRVPDAYHFDGQDGDKKSEKTLESKSKDDRIQLVLTDGKQVKQSAADVMDGTAVRNLGQPGISAIQLDFSSYQGKKFNFSTAGNSVMNLYSEGKAPLFRGFFINWVADPAKDPENKARLVIEVK